MNLLEFVVLALATWRVSHLFTQEEGPFGIFTKVREKIGRIEHDADGIVVMTPETFFGQLLSCVWCLSVWAGTFFFVAYYLFPESIVLAYPFALSASAIWVERHH
jgi:hypothetical protein